MVELNETEVAALRTCALVAWRLRAHCTESEIDQALQGWIAVGTLKEVEAAAELLAARRETARKQATFDQLLGDKAGTDGRTAA